MSLIKSGLSALGNLVIVVALAGAFIVGMAGVVYMALQGNEIKVPEITGKDFVESEKELAALGLKIKRRADRYSTEKPNSILEQLPKAGETVKTGQMILVVTSKQNPEGDEAPATIKKNEPEDDSDKIEEMITDKPKKAGKNTNTNTNKKKADTKRDVIGGGNSNSNSNSNSSDAADTPTGGSTGKDNKNTTAPAPPKPAASPAVKPAASPKPPSGGDVRPRTTPKP